MTREEIIDRFREECPEITDRVITDTVLGSWCEVGELEIACRARMIQSDVSFAATVSEDEYDMVVREPKFFDVDEYPGGGVAFNSERLTKTSISQLDEDEPGWRTASNGTPEKYFRRGRKICFNCPASAASTIKVYTIVKSNPFDDDSKTPFNELPHLEPYHYSIDLYLIMRAKFKVGKPEERTAARLEYEGYINWIKKELGGSRYAPIYLRP